MVKLDRDSQIVLLMKVGSQGPAQLHASQIAT